jgi:hypothetical protein
LSCRLVNGTVSFQIAIQTLYTDWLGDMNKVRGCGSL